MVTAFVLIAADPSRIASLAEAIADVEGVSEVYSVTGDEDLIAIVRVREHEQLAAVVTEHIACMEGIRHTRTSIAYKAFSRHDLDAIFDVGIG